MIDATGLPQPGPSAYLAATDWVQGALLGSFGTGLAIIAVALVGLRMIAGRVPKWAAVRVVLGCFVLFGAPSIASGLIAAARSEYLEAGRTPAPEVKDRPALPPEITDPNAGASAQHF